MEAILFRPGLLTYDFAVSSAAFGDCRKALEVFREAGLEAKYHSFFYGCASGLSGRRPL